MKICILSHNLNPETGIGEFVDSLIKETRLLLPQAIFTVMTDADILKPDYRSILKNWFEIRRNIRRADIIHAIDAYPYGLIAALANLSIGRPLIITAIGTGSLQLLDRFSLKSLLLHWTYGRACSLTAISNYVAQELKKHIKNKEVLIVNPGINYDYWSTISIGPIVSKLKELQPYLLTVGEFKRRKGYDVMLPIVSEVLETNTNVKYVIVANTGRNIQYRDEIRQQIKNLGLSNKTIIMSGLSREELRAVFQSAHLYLTLPQNADGDVEGFGMAILQGAATGLPALVGRGSGADDAVENNLSGLLVSSREPHAVAREINELLKDVTLREKFSDGAQEFARKMDWRNQLRSYVKIYQDLKK